MYSMFVAGPFSMIPDGEWTAKAEALFPNNDQPRAGAPSILIVRFARMPRFT
jgi:hypothetical protein